MSPHIAGSAEISPWANRDTNGYISTSTLLMYCGGSGGGGILLSVDIFILWNGRESNPRLTLIGKRIYKRVLVFTRQ